MTSMQVEKNKELQHCKHEYELSISTLLSKTQSQEVEIERLK